MSSKSKLLFVWLGIFAAGCLVGAWSYRGAGEEREGELVADARRCALVFRPEELARLGGTPADEGTDGYAMVKARLIQLRGVHSRVRSVYVLRHLPESGRVVYLVDSEPSGARTLSHPGDVLAGAGAMPGLQGILRDGRAAVEGPVRDGLGGWVTGYAAISARAIVEAGVPPRDVLGLVVAAEDWRGGLFEVAWRRAFYVWVLFGLPLGGFVLARGYFSQAAWIQKLHGAVEQSESAVMIVDVGSRIEYANAGLCRQMGYAREEIVGRRWHELKAQEKSEEMWEGLVSTVTEGRSWEGDWMNRRKDGTCYPAHGLVSPVRGPGGRLVGFIAVIVDASSARRTEETLLREKERAESGDRAKGAFLATMSHEVRTPLNAIVGFANLLLDTSLTPEQREYVQTIRNSGDALVHLAGDILDYSRIESGGVQLAAVVCDLRGAIEDALDVFAAKAAERDVQLLHSIDPDVPFQVMIDVGRLRQVLVNLVGNAIKFTPAGEVEVSLRLLTGKAMSVAPFDVGALSAHGQMVAEFEDGSLTVEFSVRDTGVGIAAEDRPRLFQPFTQLDAAETKRFGGAGLGLMISRNLVRLMGGDVWLESEPGRGSTFYFTVRCRRSYEDLVQPVANALGGRKVLVVARAEGLRDELLRVLRANGAEAVATSLDKLTGLEDALAVVDCEPALIRGWEERVGENAWPGGRAFGLIAVNVTGAERQRLRPYFRMLLNKPLHHRALVDLLAKAAKSAKGAGAEKPASPSPGAGGQPP